MPVPATVVPAEMAGADVPALRVSTGMRTVVFFPASSTTSRCEPSGKSRRSLSSVTLTVMSLSPLFFIVMGMSAVLDVRVTVDWGAISICCR